MKRAVNRWCAGALVFAVVVPAADVAYGQSGPAVDGQRLVIRDSALMMSGNQKASPQTSRTCSRGRRALIGGLIGGAASYPLGRLVYLRFANEGANDIGSSLAALVIGGSAAIGALVGRDSYK